MSKLSWVLGWVIAWVLCTVVVLGWVQVQNSRMNVATGVSVLGYWALRVALVFAVIVVVRYLLR
jgi:hypothetical protein